jgi:anti-sigma regulatory factor (Ser/Thr protein kinase)
MRSGAALGHRGYFHEAAFYQSDHEFVQIMGPFFADGLAAGEPVIAVFTRHNQSLVRAEFGAGIRYLDAERQYARPARAILAYRRLMTQLVADGATQVRIAGDVPHPGTGVPWEWWARYEAVINDAYDDFPLWGLCPYDTRTTPGEVLEEVRRCHPHIATADGHEPNPAFEDPRQFLANRPATWRDPMETRSPSRELVNPNAGEVRLVIAELSRSVTLTETQIQDLQLATTEAITNALLYGKLPVQVRIWDGPDRLLVTVTDAGPGPSDPYAGLRPVAPAALRGRGLWLIHQLCSYVTLERSPTGFTVRMLAGTPVDPHIPAIRGLG